MDTPLFIPFLLDQPTGKQWYIDPNGNPVLSNVMSGIGRPLQYLPGGWMDQKLSFIRNTFYYGFNRSYSDPFLFVKDAAKIIYNQLYTNLNGGRGTESPLTLLIFKYNSQPSVGRPLWEVYYKAPIDLPKHQGIVGEGIQCNLMEAGFMQLLKAYEDTIVQIPCDGSIPQNIKVNYDGLLVSTKLNYQFTPFNTTNVQNSKYMMLPSNFINEEGDSIGIIRNNSSSTETVYSGGFGIAGWNNSNDFILSTKKKISVTIEGNIVLGGSVASGSSNIGYINLFLATNNSISSNYNYTESTPLIPNVPGENTNRAPDDIKDGVPNIASYGVLNQQTNYQFKKTIILDVNEKLFMVFYNSFLGGFVNIISGGFTVSFNSIAPSTRAWGITWFDLFDLIIKEINKLASTSGQPFSYTFVSNLLKANLNFVVTSGDALRASGDSNYGKFFNVFQLGNVPSSDINVSYGPVIKTTLKECFKNASIVFCGAMGSDGNNTVFFEALDYVMNNNAVPYSIGEVTKFKFSRAQEYAFTGFKIGAKPKEYDQKAGKYEYNTILEMISPLKAEPLKYCDLVMSYRLDSYGIENLRYNIQDTSTTNNTADNDVFIVNTSLNGGSFDYEKLTFNSAIIDSTLSNNTNIKLSNNRYSQPIAVDTVDGSYLSLNNDPSIFVLADPGVEGIIKNITASCVGTFNGNPVNTILGLPADNVTIGFYVGGFLVDEQVFNSIGVNTPINYSFVLNRVSHVGDSAFLKISSSVGASGSLDTANIFYKNSDLTEYYTAEGLDVPIVNGMYNSNISLPQVTGQNPVGGIPTNGSGVPLVTWGFQYYEFNSILSNPNFSYSFELEQYIPHQDSGNFKYTLYKNGAIAIQSSGTAFNTGLLSKHDVETLNVGDIFYLLADVVNMDIQVTRLAITFTSQIQARNLLRVQYDYVTGLDPNVFSQLKNDTTIPGAPYNIEGLTPARLREKWGKWLRAPLFDQIPGQYRFCNLDKNQYLVTSYKGKVYDEKANIDISSLDSPIYLPIMFDFETEVPLSFNTALNNANSLIQFTYQNIPFYGFVLNCSQQPALNEKQSWQLLCSPLTDISNLPNLDADNLKNIYMQDNTIACSRIMSGKYVPENWVLSPSYDTPDVNNAFYKDQIKKWYNRKNYYQPWQIGDDMPLQFLSKGLSPVTAYLINTATGDTVLTQELTQTTTGAVLDPITEWEGNFVTTGLPLAYYMVKTTGGESVSNLLSEGYFFKPKWNRTVLIEGNNSFNTKSTVFDQGYKFRYRIPGFLDNTIDPLFIGKFYEDQPQNATITGAVTYYRMFLHIEQVPDYVMLMVMDMLTLDGITLNGIAFSLDETSKFAQEFATPGNPLKSWVIAVRPAKNTDLISSIPPDSSVSSIVISVDFESFGPNYDSQSDSIEPNIQTLTITNT